MSEPRDRPVPILERFERFLDALIPPPDEIAVLVRRGEALLGSGDAPGAQRLADTALAAAPMYLRAVLLKADALNAQGKPYDALAVLDEASRDRALPSAAIARMVEYAGAVGDERRALELEVHTRTRVRGRVKKCSSPDRRQSRRCSWSALNSIGPTATCSTPCRCRSAR